MDNAKDLAIYRKVMPLYFPRNQAEANEAEAVLPPNTGNEFGEIILEERTIRVNGALQEAGLPSEKQRACVLHLRACVRTCVRAAAGGAGCTG